MLCAWFPATPRVAAVFPSARRLSYVLVKLFNKGREEGSILDRQPASRTRKGLILTPGSSSLLLLGNQGSRDLKQLVTPYPKSEGGEQ